VECFVHIWSILGAIGLFLLPTYLSAQVCAEVKIEIPQVVSIERQAFVAKLGIENGVAEPITQFSVDLEFKDAAGNSVLITSNPNNLLAKFFLRLESTPGITGGVAGQGTIAGQSSAEANWLIIPSAGAGGTTASGLLYVVGATVRYRQNNEDKVVSVLPDSITVEPQPKLKLDYFLPIDVYGDDPFTPGIVEPSEPFTLGVRVRNVGAGRARQISIESAQPRIVANTQGLAVSFNILGAFVQNESVQNTLLMRFGEITSQTSKMGRWLMTASLSGQFTDFQAEFTHSDQLGGALTSLIDSVTTHPLVHDVVVNLPGRDSVRDFLALDGDTFRTYESDGADQIVIDRSLAATVEPINANSYRVRTTASVLPVYVRVADPSAGQWRISEFLRAGSNTSLPIENAWLSKKRMENSTNFSYYLNVYDAAGTGDYIVRFDRGALASISGAVFRDANGNGVRDDGEVGVAAVKVKASTSIAGEPFEREVATNALGDFTVDQLSPSIYTLNVGAMPGLRDGLPIVGNVNGTPSLTNGIAQISTIALSNGTNASNFQFVKVSTSTLAQADVSVNLSTLTPSIGINGTADVLVRLKNNGPDVVPASATMTVVMTQNGLVFESLTSPLGGIVSNVWNIPSLGVQEEGTLLLRVRAPSFGTKQVGAGISLSIGFPDPNTENNRSLVSISASSIPGDLIFQNGIEALGLGINFPGGKTSDAAPNQLFAAPREFVGNAAGVVELTETADAEAVLTEILPDSATAGAPLNARPDPPAQEDVISRDRFEDL
jgi:hypothetical protein